MEQALAASDLAALHEKLDLLAGEVQTLTEQARFASRRQAERDELMQDAIPIADEALQLVTRQLEDVQEYIDLCDLLRLVKRLLRNGRNIDKMLDQLESLMDLGQTIGPLTDSAFEKATDLLQSAEQRGYFALARIGGRAVDTVVTSFSPEEIEHLGDNVVPLVNVVRDVTRPQVLNLVHDVILQSEVELAQPIDTSLRSLVGQMRDPDTRRGLVLTMRVLRVIGGQAAGQAAGK